jgi:hypothetical protein
MSKSIDLLDEDRPIAEQKFACLSFISPEEIIKRKDLFMFTEFVKQFDFNKSMEKFVQFINFISFKYNINVDELMEEFKTFVESERKTLTVNVDNDFKNFMDTNSETLESEFSKQNDFTTSVRGLKVRGVFPTQAEAELRCKMIREVDPNHDVYVGPVGMWLPFHPDAYKTGKVEYLEKELNELMHQKKKNEDIAKIEFDKRVKESKLKAIQENVEKARESNNRLTQTINENGDLISIQNANTLEKTLGVNATLEEIKRELFEGDTIASKDETDHGLADALKNVVMK